MSGNVSNVADAYRRGKDDGTRSRSISQEVLYSGLVDTDDRRVDVLMESCQQRAESNFGTRPLDRVGVKAYVYRRSRWSDLRLPL